MTTPSTLTSVPGNSIPGYLQREGGAMSPFNTIAFVVSQMLAGIATAMVVKVVSVIPNPLGGLLPGTVNVQPLVNQLDPDGTPFPHGTIFGVPFIRLQGGGNAIICDPQPGDTGIIIVIMRDISKVKKNGGVQNPGSRRQFSMSDGIYIGGWGNTAPTQYVQFLATGINIVDINGNTIAMSPAGIAINSAAAISLTAATTITETDSHGSFGPTNHIHEDPQGGTVGPPID